MYTVYEVIDNETGRVEEFRDIESANRWKEQLVSQGKDAKLHGGPEQPPTVECRILLEAAKAILPDLERYVRTHGPGPDRRLDALRTAIDATEKA